MSRIRQSLSLKIILGIVLLSVLSFAVAFIVLNVFVRDVVYTNARDVIHRDKIILTEQMNAWFDQSNVITQNLGTALVNAGNREAVQSLVAAFVAEHHFITLAYTGFGDGTPILNIDLDLPAGFDVRTRPWYIAAMQDRGAIVTIPPYVSAADDTLVTTVSRFLGNIDGDDWVVGVDILLDYILDLVQNTEVAGGGYLFFMTQDGGVIAHPDPAYNPTALGLTPLSSVSHYTAFANRMLAGENFIQMDNAYGVYSYFIQYRLPANDWILVAAVPVSAITEPVTATLLMITLIFLAIIMVICAFVYVIITKWVIRPIRKLQGTLGEVSRGNLSIEKSRTSEDEIGQMTQDIYELTDVMKSLADGLSTFHEEVEIKGNIHYRIDASQYNGTFREICEKQNTIVDDFMGALKLMFDVLEAIGNGDFDMKIPQLVGDKAIVNKNFDNLVVNIKSIYAEIERLFESAAHGILDVDSNASKYKGQWRELLENIDGLLASISDPINEIKIALAQMAKGDFETPVTGDYKGSFLALKETVNATGMELVQNVHEITKILQALAQGDLTVPVDRSFLGSYTPIKLALIDILKALNSSLWAIQGSAEQVREGSEQMANNVESLASGTTRQAGAIQELNVSLESINDKTRLSAEIALNANERSLKSNESAQSGASDVETMVKAIEGIKSSSDNISSIVKLIEDISFQTNLLALNASVEAARAGEHGKGFAVVAEEVRSLANRSQSATKDTTAEIAESLRRVDEGMNVAASTAESLSIIVNHVQEVSGHIVKIAEMAQEQAESIERVYKGVSEISQVVQANLATSEESAEASRELKAQAEVLKNAVSFFNVRPPRKPSNYQ